MSRFGSLQDFYEAGVIEAPDAHVAAALFRIAGLEIDVPVGLGAALCVRALRAGSVCVDLAEGCAPWVPEDSIDLPWPEDWASAFAGHPLVACGADGPPDRPLRLVGSLLYLQRYWADERLVAAEVAARSAPLAPLPTPDRSEDRQELAVRTAARYRFCIVAGGPGTGKTTTVAKIISHLRALEPGTAIALAAPTGKAAARLSEAVGEPASTLHRLLGRRRGSSSRFRHDRGNPLPFDVVIVDEASMVSLPLMARLLEAVRPEARVILVGDPDQLASVEAGAVLADLVGVAGTVVLDRNYRFGGGISALAAAIRSGDAEQVLAVLTAGHPDVSLVADEGDVRGDVVRQYTEVAAHADHGEAGAALRALEQHRVLCAHRLGRYGVQRWNALIADWTGAPSDPWHVGRPLIVTGNDYSLGLFNGDTGVIVRTGDGVRAAFERGDEVVLIPPARLDAVETVHAMTIHRSQGSQFRAVSVVLPTPQSPLLTRELLYTAVTRAQERVRVVGTPDSVRAAVNRRVRRASGLSAVR